MKVQSVILKILIISCVAGIASVSGIAGTMNGYTCGGGTADSCHDTVTPNYDISGSIWTCAGIGNCQLITGTLPGGNWCLACDPREPSCACPYDPNNWTIVNVMSGCCAKSGPNWSDCSCSVDPNQSPSSTQIYLCDRKT